MIDYPAFGRKAHKNKLIVPESSLLEQVMEKIIEKQNLNSSIDKKQVNFYEKPTKISESNDESITTWN